MRMRAFIATVVFLATPVQRIFACCGGGCENEVSIVSFTATPSTFTPQCGGTTEVAFTVTANNGQSIAWAMSCPGSGGWSGSGPSPRIIEQEWDGSCQAPGATSCMLLVSTSGGTCTDDGPAAAFDDVGVTLGGKIEVVDVAFDYADGSGVDGQNVRIDYSTDIHAYWRTGGIADGRGEWVKGLRNEPAAIIGNAYASAAPLKVHARFTSDAPEECVLTATLSATSPNFGDFSPETITIPDGDESAWIEFDTTTARLAKVKRLVDAITWKVKDVTGSGGPTCPSTLRAINTSGPHMIYVLLKPAYPTADPGYMTMREPWTKVLEHTAVWADDKTTQADAAEAITRKFYDACSLEYAFDTGSNFSYQSGGTPAPDWHFELTEFLVDLCSSAKYVNCHDTGLAIATFAGSLGAPTDKLYVEKDCAGSACPRYPLITSIVTNVIDPIGVDTAIGCAETPPTTPWRCPTNNVGWWPPDPDWPAFMLGDISRPGGYENHGFAALDGAGGKAYDATLRFDSDGDSDDTPTTAWSYVTGVDLTLAEGYLYVGVRDHNNIPTSDPLKGSTTPFQVE